MSKWSDADALAAFREAGVRELLVGRAILSERERAEKAEQRCAELAAAEKEVSDAYLRVRALLKAYNTASGGADRYAVTEAAISALQQRCAALEQANSGMAVERETLELRIAALEAALRGVVIRHTHDTYQNLGPLDFSKSAYVPGCPACGVEQALSGDISALREMLVKAILHATHGRYGKAWFDGHEREAADIAKRVMEGR